MIPVKRHLKSVLRQIVFSTPQERLANNKALSFFFGALIGANLGTVDGFGVRDHVWLITYLTVFAMAVFGFLSTATTKRAVYTLILMAGVLGIGWADEDLRVEGFEAQIDRILINLTIWAAFAAVVRFYPVKTDLDDPAPTTAVDQPPHTGAKS